MTEKRKRPTATAEIDGETLRKIAELLPAVREWAKAEGMPATSPADVIALAVALMHEQVFIKVDRMVREQTEAAEDEGGELWPTKSLH